MQRALHGCFNRGLATDPNQAGLLTVVANIGSEGQVVSATPKTNVGLNKDVVDCVLRRVKATTFAPPTAASAQVTIPIKFAQD
jgi:hypothetical protein